MSDHDHSLAGQTAFITGAARGQGRSHAVELARRGAAILAFDICAQIESVPYAMSTPDDMAETVRQVEAVGGQIVPVVGDVREPDDLAAAVQTCRTAFGHPDIVLANAGVSPQRLNEPDAQQVFLDTIAVNLTGVWNTVHAIAPGMIEAGTGGSIVITSSAHGLIARGGDGSGGVTAYTASKHGLVGLMRSFMMWLSPHGIRVNSIHPTGVQTPMVEHEVMAQWAESVSDGSSMSNVMPVFMVEPIDITRAVLYLVGESGRYVTGVTLPVDAGFTSK